MYLQASQHRSAQAMFNLGLMHEHGIGLPKDLHLAKRYYDMVLSTDPKAGLSNRIRLSARLNQSRSFIRPSSPIASVYPPDLRLD